MKSAPLKLAISCILTAFTFIITSCGGGGSSSNTPPTPTVSLSGQPSSLTTGATASITATTSTGVGVAWTVTCTTSPCGSFSATSTASGAATVYTAPATVQSVTITATTSSGTAASMSTTISITAPPISVTISNPPSSVAAGTTANLTATVTNDSQNKGVTWTVTCSAAPCGSFNPTSTASGSATVYTAPPAIPTSGTVTVTATSVTDTTKSATATITITAPGISVALNPTPASSMIVGATTSLTAVVSNDSQNKGVTWTVTCANTGTNVCGSFNPASTASATATVYTAPTTLPNPATVKVTATSVTDTTKSASATITINPILANGTYVFHTSGWDSTGPAFFAGAFTVASGAITGGELDFTNPNNGYANDPLIPANSSLSVAGNNIQIVLATSNTAIGINGVLTLRGAPVSSSRVLISEFDTFASTTGSIDLQTTPVAPPSGGYAFVISGFDISNTNNPPNNPFSIGGVLNFTGTSLNIGGSVFDYNFAFQPKQGQLFTSGSVTQPDSFGRVSFTFTPASTSGVPAFVLTGYIVSPNQIQLIESQGPNQGDVLNDDLAGMALGQGSNTGKFTLSSLSGTTYVFAAPGYDVNNYATFGGNLSFGSTGGVAGTLAINDIRNFVTSNITGGTYTVDPTGRATMTSVVTSQFPNDPFGFQLYLDGNGNALEMGVDTLQLTAGPAYLKTATSNDFEGPYALSGSGQIFTSSTSQPVWGAVGPVALSSDNLTGTTDYNVQLSTPAQAQAVTGTENSTAGTLSVTGLDSSALTTSRLYSYFPIDSKRVLAIETDGKQLGILAFESNSH